MKAGRLREVARRYPFLRDNYPFMERARRAAGNRALRRREARRFIEALEGQVGFFLEAEDQQRALAEELARRFEEGEPSEALLHLLEDALTEVLIEVLYRSGRDEEQAYARLAQSWAAALEETDFEEIRARYSAVEKVLYERDLFSYRTSDRETREQIRRQAAKYAKENRVSDREAAAMLDRRWLERRARRKAVFFTVLNAALPAAATAGLWAACGPAAVFLLLPVWTVCCEMTMALASVFTSPAPIAKTNEERIDAPVLTAVTVLLTDEEEVKNQARRLRRMYRQNPEAGITFGLLADFREADRPELPEDAVLEEAAVREIAKLNAEFPGRFCLFLRGRTLSPTQGVYMGWERKRGALIELTRLMKGEPTTFRRVIAEEDLLGRTAYLLTLDADTDLSIGAVMTLYRAMRHPENRPVIENGVVTRGYGVLQPRMVTGVIPAAKSAFATLISGGGGSDGYRSAVFDYYQTVYGKGAFCGKGMFDVEAFRAVIDGAFPDGRILSHDLLEGTRLRCGYMSELTLTDTCPATARSYYKRQHRWMRGDFQSLPFAFARMPFMKKDGKRVKNPIDALSRYMIVSNVTRALTPAAALCALFAARLVPPGARWAYLLAALAYLVFPFVTALARTARYVHRRFYSAVLQNVWQGFFTALFSLAGLAYDALLALDAAGRVLYRSLVSGKKLLEWTTAGQSEKRQSGAGFLTTLWRCTLDALPSLAVGALLFFAGGRTGRLPAAAFFLFPLICAVLSRPRAGKKGPSKEMRAELVKYAMESFAYFERFVTEEDRFLPPDNYEEHPAEVLARRTSPTNIALYLTSAVAMHDLGLMTEEELLDRLGKTAETLSVLPKYRGHLYNWYSTETLAILGAPYISTVDSGNCVLGLIAVREALRELDSPAARRLERTFAQLIEKTDFSFLYNEKKKLLCIGYDPLEEKQSEGCYDLLASEARSAYLYAIAAGQIPRASFSRLGRPVTAKDGHIGLLSFSGTAFEYFMPCLFLPVYPNTLLYEALYFALYEQQRDRERGVWGRSESCYFAFDREMNYQYRAFGCASLALDPTTGKENVVAPYASFLALALAPGRAFENLRKMEKLGLKGAYGFYEAVDFTQSRVGKGAAVIRAYMAHHIGMSVTAAANACLDGIFVRRVLADEGIDAALELLSERVPTDSRAVRRPAPRRARAPRLPFLPASAKGGPIGDEADMAMLSGGGARLLCSGDGRIELSYRDVLFTLPVGMKEERRPAFSLRTASGLFTLSDDLRFYADGRKVGFSKNGKDGTLSVEGEIAGACGFAFTLSGTLRRGHGALEFFAPLPFCTRGEYLTHPAYPALSVFSEYDDEQKVLLFGRRRREKEEKDLWLAFAFAGGRAFDFAAREDDLPEKEDGAPLARICGPARKPAVLLRLPLEGEGPFRTVLFAAPAESAGEAIEKVKELRAACEKKKGSARDGARKEGALASFPDRAMLEWVSLLLQGMTRFRRRDLSLPCLPVGELWKYGISGDLPVFCFLLPEKPLSGSQKKVLLPLLRAHAELQRGGFPCDLVFWRREREKYYSPAKKELLALIQAAGGRSSAGRRSGLHLLFDDGAPGVLPSFARTVLALDRDCIFQSLRRQFLSQLEPENDEKTVVSPPEKGFSYDEKAPGALPCGVFTGDGFLVNKARRPYSPFSFLYCSAQFGTLLTDRSLGFTWVRNSGELRLTPFPGDESRLPSGERLLLFENGGALDLCAASASVFFGFDRALYEGETKGLSYKLSVGVDDKLPVKLLVLKLTNRSDKTRRVKLVYKVEPALFKTADGRISEKREGGLLFFKRTAAYAGVDFGMYLSFPEREAELPPGGEEEFLFHLGAVNLKNDRCCYRALEKLKTPEDAGRAFGRYKSANERFTGRFTVDTGDPAEDLFLSRFLPYQVLTSRLLGRTGFFQPGGAYGFRDQLQDALSMLPYDPSILRVHLLRAAAHQYAEGDVQHWWHRVEALGLADAGVRTACSDDLLWLPYACARYLAFTGDEELAEKRIAYLSSPPLKDLADRYERPGKTARKETLYDHCVRALDRALSSSGPHGLCLTGSCDWNDGLSEVGGESVWLTQFLALTLRVFLPFARQEDRERFEKAEERCISALDRCFAGDRFLRAFFADGAPLGREGCPFCAIDLLPQSFAVFLGVNEKSAAAILRAYDLLFDGKTGVFKLFSPPYDSAGRFPGRLGGYCPGFRENGGQYTHAAVWGAMALLRAEQLEKGYGVLRALSPVCRCKKDFSRYALEPYALAGDVYSAAGYEGRGGWSQYTGAAGWYLTAFFSELLGYKERKEGFTLDPRLFDAFPRFSLTVKKERTVYKIDVSRGERPSALLDKKPAPAFFPFDGKTHELKIVLAKSREMV